MVSFIKGRRGRDMKLIYLSKRPKFAILTDKYQWILSNSWYPSSSDKGRSYRTKYCDLTYHPNLSNLLDELAEQQFRNFATKIDNLKELDKSISKVYKLISRVYGKLI